MVSAVSVLTIHVSDTNIHQSVFRFLTDELKLPVEYGPVMMGERRYAAVYAGNMFIEPCGPYSDMSYPVKDFEALFFGLNCGSDQAPSSLAKELRRLNIPFEQLSPETFRIQDEVLASGIYFAISAGPESKADQEKKAALLAAMKASQRDGLGLEYVKEIWLGYTAAGDLDRWRQFLGDSSQVNDSCWTLANHQRLRMVRSPVRGVVGIVWKARSLETAAKYLKQAGCYGGMVDGKIELDRRRTHGLLIYLSDESK